MSLKRLLVLAAWTGVLTIIILSLVPGQERPHTGFTGHEEHFAAYAATGAVFALAFRHRIRRLWSIFGLSLLSVAMEIGQNFSPGRHPAVSDVLFSSLGAVAGIAAGTVMLLLLDGIPRNYPPPNHLGPLRQQRRDSATTN